MALEWTADGKKLAAITDRGWLHVWCARTGAHLVHHHLGRTRLLTVAWERQGRALAVGGANGALYRIEHLTDPKVTIHFFADPVTHVSWSCSPVGRCMVVYGQTLTVLDGRGQPPVTKRYSAPILDAGWSADGRTLAVLCQDGLVEAWDTDQLVDQLLVTDILDPRCLAWHRDGHRLAIGTAPGQIQVCDVPTGHRSEMRLVSGFPIQSLNWGQHYLVAKGENERDLVFVDEAKKTHHLPSAPSALKWNPQGTLLASGYLGSVALATF